jgi:lipopolysaccharide transport system ATP-binding protein
MSSFLVEACGLSKTYNLWLEPADRLTCGLLQAAAATPWLPGSWRGGLAAAATRRGREFLALQDVSFTLMRGESLGVIGRNGSGKSTLLQILASTLQPTAGRFSVQGRVAALLELGSGFNPEFSGRENVVLQAALHGVGRREATARFAEIEEFAGIGAFIDQPVKVFSSGMLVRLAFATQTVLAPDLFIVDEALSVGDVFFQARCARFFRERLTQGMSLILVSHDLPAVKAFCARTIVLHEGRVSFFGPSAEAVSHYHQLYRGNIVTEMAGAVEAPKANPADEITLPAGEVERNWDATHEVGSREAEIVHCRLLNARGEPAGIFGLGETVHVECHVRSRVPLDQAVACLEVSNRLHQVLYGVTSNHLGLLSPELTPGRLRRVVFSLSARMGPGDYLVDLAIGWGDRGDGAPVQLVHRVAAIASFQVHHAGPPRFFGPANLGATLRWN